MLEIKQNYSLKPHNAFHLDVKARYYTEIGSEEQLSELLDNRIFKNSRRLILGKGANILFSGDFDGLVVRVGIKGKEIVEEDSESVVLELGGGEDWTQLVEYSVSQGWGGIENLALIPGTVGAAPVQNIGAFGQSLVDSFDTLDAVDLETGHIKLFTKDECLFTYRSSIFKTKFKGRYMIVRVRLKLRKSPELDISYYSRYESIEEELRKIAKPPYTLRDVYQAVISIRSQKLPDINKVGSAGSFFKNPVISKEKLSEIQKSAPGVQFYPVDQLTYPKPDEPLFEYEKYVKVAAGWLLEEIGWRGKRVGNCGTWPKHALIVVNYGGASSQELLDFVELVRRDFYDHYGICLEDEINVM